MFILNYFKFELKKWFRDSFTSFVLVYPLLMGLTGRYLVPLIEKQMGSDLSAIYPIILVGLSMISAKIAGAVVGFSILDDRDDNILYTVQVAPLSMEVFIGLKLLLVYILSVIGTVFVLWFSNLGQLPWSTMISISLLAAIQAPLLALLINYVASNKVEGFAAIKGLNVLVVFPIVALFFHDIKEFLFAIEPSFWPAKALFGALTGTPQQLSFSGYYTIGLVYALLATYLAYRGFAKKVY